MMTNADPKLNYPLQRFSSSDRQQPRKKLMALFEASPLPKDHLMVNLGLYQRSSVVAKFLYLNELYQHIIDIPGVIMEFGVWWGQTLVQFQNLRAVYEPYNRTRKVIGFDTFEGYSSPVGQDANSSLVQSGQYAVSADYVNYLTELMRYHDDENGIDESTKFELVKGDATRTTQKYLKDHPETIIALAYLDMQLYEPTRECLDAILPHMVKGSVIAMDELNCADFPGETIAFKENVGLRRFPVRRSRFLPDRTYFVVE